MGQQVTFIGGSLDLTRQVLPEAPKVYRRPLWDARANASISFVPEEAFPAPGECRYGFEEYERWDGQSPYSAERVVVYVFSRRDFSKSEIDWKTRARKAEALADALEEQLSRSEKVVKAVREVVR